MKAKWIVTLSVSMLVVLGCAFACSECPQMPAVLFHNIFLNEDFISPNVRFNPRIAGDGHTQDGLAFSFTVWRASDCVEVEAVTENFDSPAQIQVEFEKITKSATRTVELSLVTDEGESEEAQRVVLFSKDEHKFEIVVWFSGTSKLYTIKSRSLAHALAYERKIRG